MHRPVAPRQHDGVIPVEQHHSVFVQKSWRERRADMGIRHPHSPRSLCALTLHRPGSRILSASGVRACQKVIRIARELNPAIRVLARTDYVRAIDALRPLNRRLTVARVTRLIKHSPVAIDRGAHSKSINIVRESSDRRGRGAPSPGAAAWGHSTGRLASRSRSRTSSCGTSAARSATSPPPVRRCRRWERLGQFLRLVLAAQHTTESAHSTRGLARNTRLQAYNSSCSTPAWRLNRGKEARWNRRQSQTLT